MALVLRRVVDHGQWIVRRGGRFLFTVLCFPGVLQLLCFGVLFRLAQKKWCDNYCGVWEPSYPQATTTWVLFLAILPIFAGLQLVWLLGFALVGFLRRRRRGYGNGTTMVDEGEEYIPLRQAEGDEINNYDSPTSLSNRASSPRPSQIYSRLPSSQTIFWCTQVLLYFCLLIVGTWQFTHYQNEDDIRYLPALQKALAHKDRDMNGYGNGEKIFFAASFFNNEDMLPYWCKSLLDTIVYYGPNNIYVSIVESYSTDRSPDILRQLDESLEKLGVPHRVLVQDTAVKKSGDTGWDTSGNGRIDFLAANRNRVLEPLVENGGYDKVVFSNDIFIEPESIIELVETADGQYDMVCAMDFAHFGAYDMWVLRDRLGHLTGAIWPYFFDSADYLAVKAGSPVPVFSCWNGIVVFAADPILPIHLRSNRTLSTSPLKKLPPSTHPLANSTGPSPALTPPLTFRSSPHGEGCYSSESFLLPYDMRRIMGLERMFVNPRVITAYQWRYYVWHKWILRHRYVRWFVEKVYDGAWMQYTRLIVGDDDKVYTWDGGDCHPWWYEPPW